MLWSSGIIFIVQFITLLVTCLLCRNIVNLKSDFQCWEMTVKWYFQAKYWMIYRLTIKSWFRKKTWTPQVDRDLIFKTQGKRIWLPWRWLCTGKLMSYRYWRSRATVQKVAPKSNIILLIYYYYITNIILLVYFQLYLTQNITIGDIVYTAADPSAK